jgi:hypothetical protein
MALPNALSTYNFPDAYDSLVDSATSVKYVSASGSDSNNGNTATTPYLTIAQALSATSSTATTVTIVVLAGTYNISATDLGNSYGAACILDSSKPRVFVCCPGQVIINCTDSTGLRDFAPVRFLNSSSAIYGAIIKRNNGGRTNSYSVSVLNDESVGFKGSLYNTVFQEVNSNNAWGIQYDNGSDSTAKAYNCTFYNGANATGDYSGSTGCVITDTVFNTSASSSATFTGCLTNQTVNATTYVTTGITNKGVYSGTYAWNGTTTIPDPGFYAASATVVSGSTIYLTYFHTSSSATVSYTITGVTSSDLNGTSLTGTMSVTNSSATLSIPTITKLAATNTFTITAGSYSTSVTISAAFACEVLIVAGGGSGGNHYTTNANGGGGAGGVLQGSLALAGGTFTVAVGGGGTAIANSTASNGIKGTDSSIGAYIAEGGGGGGSSGVAFSGTSQNGGSGGGNAYYQTGGGLANINNNAGGLTALGYNGGQTSTTWTGAGGGGAGAVGQAGTGSSPGGNGGTGITNTWTGSTLYLAGGGGGGGNSSERAGDGFYGGGRGEGSTSYYSYNVYTNEVNATTKGSGIPTAIVNSGGGGGGGSYWAANGGWSTGSGAGGSGRVLIRYAGAPIATGGTITQSGGYTIHEYLTSGTFVTPTPGLTSDHQTSAYWGETITFTYVADVADATTRSYTISGVTSGQINGASLSGNFTFSGSIATVTVVLATQSTNTTATMVFTSGSTTFTINVSNIVSFVSSSSGTYWGGSITYTATVRGLSSGGTVPYSISGVTSAQISNANLADNATTVLAGYGYSTYYNGTTSKLSIPASADFAFGTGDFTIEFWIKTTDTVFEMVTQTTTSTPNWGIVFTSGNIYWQKGFAAEGLLSTYPTIDPLSGSWTHIAFTRNGSGTGNIRFWINGVGQTAYSGADTTNYTGTGPIQIAGTGNQYGFFNGYISNLRIVKGVAVYTGNFTVPTSSLTATQSSGTNISAITGTQTSLLCCQSATVIDNSAAARTITNTGVTVSSDAPFGNNALASVGGGIAAFTVTTNPTEPILNSATMVTSITGGTKTNVIRTGNPRLFQNLYPSIQSLVYAYVPTTDVHKQILEATAKSVSTINSIVESNTISTAPNALVYVNTQTTDIHKQALEATTKNITTVNSIVEPNSLVTNLNGLKPAPTYAYSSGEVIAPQGQGTATISQTWTIS